MKSLVEWDEQFLAQDLSVNAGVPEPDRVCVEGLFSFCRCPVWVRLVQFRRAWLLWGLNPETGSVPEQV